MRKTGWNWIFPLAALLVALGVGAVVFHCFEDIREVHEFPGECDPFGYLYMAREIKQAREEVRYPSFQIEHPQIRKSIENFRSSPLPSGEWSELIAPHACHYFPQTNTVGLQYPPGTGLVLSFFPIGSAVYFINLLTLASLFLGSLVLLFLCLKNRNLYAMGMVGVTGIVGAETLSWIKTRSYSINCVVLPLLLSSLFTILVRRQRKPLFFSLTAGLFFGLALYIRLPCVFLLPGFLIALIRPRHTHPLENVGNKRRYELGLFTVGLLIAGGIPLLCNQSQITGAWYQPTYSSLDHSLPVLNQAFILERFHYYLGGGVGSAQNWAITNILPALLGGFFLLWTRRRLSVGGVLVGALLCWLLPCLYFVTHQVVVPYYSTPGVMACLFLITFYFSTESSEQIQEYASPQALWQKVVLFLIFVLPFGALIERARLQLPYSPLPSRPGPAQFKVPNLLLDDATWILADVMSGTFYYFAAKPAFKVSVGSPRARRQFYQMIQKEGGRIFLLKDSKEMTRMMTELKEDLRAQITPSGDVNGYPLFEVSFPQPIH